MTHSLPHAWRATIPGAGMSFFPPTLLWVLSSLSQGKSTRSPNRPQATDPTQLLVSLVSDIVEHVERTIIESSVLETLRVSQEKQKQAIHSGLPDSSLSRVQYFLPPPSPYFWRSLDVLLSLN